jgi:NAD(P)-dependent dehydrogenase (short-subunit alcohol dehydrogenase family)
VDLHLLGKTALIVGGSSGIGAACVRRFVDEGARVIIWDILVDSAPDVGIKPIYCDVTKLASVELALKETALQSPTIDCLVHAAAIGSGYFGFPFSRVPLESWGRVLEVNVMGMANVAYAVAPIMQQQLGGSMVFLSSVAGQIGSQTDPPYSASKAANLNFAICLAKDLAAHRIRVNSVCPGMVKTKLNRSVWQAWHDAAPLAERLEYERWAEEKIRKVCPLGQWQSVDDIADAILFLSSSRAAQITGQAINVDGGFVMRI